MNEGKNPVRNTVIYGLGAAMFALVASLALAPHLRWSTTIALIFATVILGYGILLCRWTTQETGRLFFPGLLLLSAALAGTSSQIFMFMALAVLAWTRSSLCYSQPALSAVIIEVVMCGISAGFFYFFSPFSSYDTLSLAVGIWLFFLIQSLYFLLFEKTDREDNRKNSFTRAQRVAEKIIAADGI